MGKIFAGDVGTEIVVDCDAEIGSATKCEILVRKPGASGFVRWSATLEGTTRMKYVIQAGDLSVPGTYQLQAYVEMPGWSGKGETALLEVAPAFG